MHQNSALVCEVGWLNDLKTRQFGMFGSPDRHVKHGSSLVVTPWIHDGQYSKLLPFLVPGVHVQLTRIALLKVESVWHSLLLHLFPYQVCSMSVAHNSTRMIWQTGM